MAWMGPATVFPQAVGLGATWNDDLVRRVGEAVGNEVRAMRAKDDRVGLNVWAPTVNLLRHPLWGRDEEGYSEDAALTSAIAVAYTRGLRGDHPHVLAHRPGAQALARPQQRDGPGHLVLARSARACCTSTTCAPSATPCRGGRGGRRHARLQPGQRPPQPCLAAICASSCAPGPTRTSLVCSDAGAPSNLVDSEHYFDTHEEATAAALMAGVDSFTDHGTDTSSIDRPHPPRPGAGPARPSPTSTPPSAACSHLRFSPGRVRPAASTRTRTPRPSTRPAHRALAQEAAEQAVVLLKNDGLLPLDPAAPGTIAVVGLLADECKLDWYSGTLIHRSTPLDGLRERFGADRVDLRGGRGPGTPEVRGGLRC